MNNTISIIDRLVKVTLALVCIAGVGSTALATVVYGPIADSAGAPLAIGSLTFVAYVGANGDDYIMTEKYSNGYTINNSNIGIWQVNTANFSDEQLSGTVPFNIKFDAGGYTAAIQASVDTTQGTSKIPATGNTALSNASALAVPAIAVAPGNGQLIISWSAVSDATNYRLYRANADNGYFKRINDNATSPYTDNGLINGTNYYYVLVAANATTTSPHSAVMAGAPNATAGPTLLSITVTPAGTTVTEGSTQQFASTGKYSDDSTKDLADQVSWSSSNTSVAAINSTGIATAVAAGTSTITARKDSIEGSTTLTVSAVPLESITVTPAVPSITAGQTQQFTATGSYAGAPNRDITSLVSWTSSASSVATVAAGGLATAVGVGQANITASYAGKNATQKLTVGAGSLYTLTLSGPDSVQAGSSATYTVTGVDKYNNPITAPAVVWTTTAGTISGGLLTGLDQAGTVTVQAAAGSVSAQKSVTVTARYAAVVAKLENGKITLYGRDAQGTLTLLGADQTASYAVTGAEYGNLVAADGTFTAGNKEGTFIVTATAVIDGLTYTATSDVNVNTGAPTISAKVNGQSLLSNMTIASKPQLDIDLVDGNGVKAVRVFIDGVAVQGLSVNAANIGAATLTASFKAERALAAGSHTIVIEADDNLGTTARLTASGLKVYSDLTIQGRPMNYPNPFKPASEATKINYQLSKDADVKLMIYDLSGRLVYSQVYSAGSEGGKAGENNPPWDGKNFTGNYVGNGVYVYYLTAGGRPLGSGELSVYQ